MPEDAWEWQRLGECREVEIKITKPHRGPSAVQTGLPGTRISNTSLNSGDEAPSQPLLSPQPPGLFLELHPSEGAHPAIPGSCKSPASLPCRGPSEQGPEGPTPPAKGTQPHPRRSLQPVTTGAAKAQACLRLGPGLEK